MSLDALTGKDLSFGPVQELYVATLMEWGGNSDVNTQKSVWVQTSWFHGLAKLA